MDPFTTGIVGVVALVLMVFLGVRVYIAAAAVGLVGLVALIGWDAGAGMAGTIPHSKSISYTLSVLPMFILIGFLAFHAGLTEKLFDAATKWLGWVPGGLAVATVMAATGFAAVSGASTATAAVFSRVAVPDMLKAGYDKRLAAGVVAAGGTLATLIPPSAILVIYAIIVEESVGRLLVAGFVPGIVSALIYVGLIVLMAGFRPSLGRPIRGFTWGQRWRAVPGTFPIAAVVVIIFSAMYFGWATPTEAGSVGAVGAVLLAAARGLSQEVGADAVTLRETARRAGVSHAAARVSHARRENAVISAKEFLHTPEATAGQRGLFRPEGCLRLLVAAEQGCVLTVTFRFETGRGDETHRRGVHAVAQAGRRGAVLENVAEVGVGVFRANFGADHEELAIALRDHVLRLERAREARPAGSGVVFVERREERLTRNDVDVNARLLVVPVFVTKSRLGTVVLRDLVLDGGQALLELGVAGTRGLLFHGHSFAERREHECCDRCRDDHDEKNDAVLHGDVEHMVAAFVSVGCALPGVGFIRALGSRLLAVSS